jgi:hypothetical protein
MSRQQRGSDRSLTSCVAHSRRETSDLPLNPSRRRVPLSSAFSCPRPLATANVRPSTGPFAAS